VSEEVRTISATGGEKGVKRERYDLLPKEALDAIARVYAFGATKYSDHNWRKGYEWSKSYAAAMRHLTSFWAGETLDPESGLPHLAHAGFHIFALLTWLEEQGEFGQFDDRYRSERLVDEREGDVEPVTPLELARALHAVVGENLDCYYNGLVDAARTGHVDEFASRIEKEVAA